MQAVYLGIRYLVVCDCSLGPCLYLVHSMSPSQRAEYGFGLGYLDEHRFSMPENIERDVGSDVVKAPAKSDCYFASLTRGC
jgi:hypothetical protein